MIKDDLTLKDPKDANLSGAIAFGDTGDQKYLPTSHMSEDTKLLSKYYKNRRAYWMNVWKKFC